MEVSLCIVSFDMACLLSTVIHSKTISWMGRKNALLIGFGVQITTIIGCALLAYIPPDQPKTFVWANIVIRFFQGYGDSLTWITAFTIISMTFQEDKAKRIGQAEAAQGLGEIIGPVIGSLIYGVAGY